MRDLKQNSSPRRTATGSGLEQRVLRRSRDLGLPNQCSVVVGFSDGEDSLALLGVLTGIRGLSGIEPIAVHVDHGLRPESAAEQETAKRMAANLGARFVGVRIDAEAWARHPSVGIEDAARRERFALLAQIAHDHDAAAIALAHHQSDQAETVLLHLLRGAGLTGAVAMADACVRRFPLAHHLHNEDASFEVVIWRPFLTEAKSDIASYASLLGLTPIDDPSNHDCRFRRNAIRHRVLPLLEEIQPGATAALARYATLAAADEELLAGLVRSLLDAENDEIALLENARVVGQPVALQRRLIRVWLGEMIPGIEVRAERIEAVRALALCGEPGKLIEVAAGFGVTLQDGSLRIVAVEEHHSALAAKATQRQT